MNKKTILTNPKLYGLLGLIFVAVPILFFFFAGMPGTSVTETAVGSNRTIVTETVWIGAYNPFLLFFVLCSVIAALGCYRSVLMAWVGSILLLVLSILGMFSIGLFALPGTIFLLVGAALKTREHES